MSFQIGFALKEAPKGIPRYFIDKDNTLQPKILVKPNILSIKPTQINSDLAKLIFKPEIASKHKNKQRKWRRWSGFAPQKNWSVIRKQKMRDIKPTNIPYPRREAKQQTPINCNKNHPT